MTKTHEEAVKSIAKTFFGDEPDGLACAIVERAIQAYLSEIGQEAQGHYYKDKLRSVRLKPSTDVPVGRTPKTVIVLPKPLPTLSNTQG